GLLEAQRFFTSRVARSIAHEITDPGFHHTFAVQFFFASRRTAIGARTARNEAISRVARRWRFRNRSLSVARANRKVPGTFGRDQSCQLVRS
ncbi:MAG: hypothetical protein DWH97_12485, partial [Planctomycetota bacterium]